MKKKTNISDKAIKIIKKNQIKPIPKWEFVVKNWGLWFGFGLCLIFLILGASVSWFGLAQNIITPYFWILITVIFAILTYLIFEQTKKAYRLQKLTIMLFIIFISLIIGGTLFKVGLGNRIDRNLESKVSFYRHIVPMKMTVWNNPESGYLSGKIIKITDTNSFVIRDFDGNDWIIVGQNPLIKGRVQIVIGEEIKIIGTKVGNNTFKIDEIRPWNGMGQNIMKEN